MSLTSMKQTQLMTCTENRQLNCMQYTAVSQHYSHACFVCITYLGSMKQYCEVCSRKLPWEASGIYGILIKPTEVHVVWTDRKSRRFKLIYTKLRVFKLFPTYIWKTTLKSNRFFAYTQIVRLKLNLAAMCSRISLSFVRILKWLHQFLQEHTTGFHVRSHQDLKKR